MTTIRDAARVVVAGMPEEDDYRRDAYFCWRRARHLIADAGRKDPEACKPLILDGIPGVLWWGQVAAIRRYLWGPGQPKNAPYTAGGGCGEEAAAQNFRKVHRYLTRETASMICVEDHRGGDSLWWVADSWGDQVTAERYEELKALAQGNQPAPSPVPAPMPGFTAPPAPPAPAEQADVLPCRYRLATGCAAKYAAAPSLYSHEELSATHHGHRVTLLACPLCREAFASAQGRSIHLTNVHQVKTRTARRIELDAEQTKELYDANQASHEARQARKAVQEAPPVPDEVDPDVQAALDARRPAAPVIPPAVASAGEEDPRITALRTLIAEYDQVVAERDALRSEKADQETRFALAREALGL